MNIRHDGELNGPIQDPDDVMVPVLVCSGCGRKMQLPYRGFQNSSVVEPYWPPLHQPLDWVCDGCGQYNTSAQDDLEWDAEESLPLLGPGRGFWRVEIACSTPGCSSSIAIHTQTFGQTSRRNLGLMIARASPTPACGLGHDILPERSYPERVDFIEWTGAEEYLA